jgi:hypothetical protein
MKLLQLGYRYALRNERSFDTSLLVYIVPPTTLHCRKDAKFEISGQQCGDGRTNRGVVGLCACVQVKAKRE